MAVFSNEEEPHNAEVTERRRAKGTEAHFIGIVEGNLGGA
jgi:hypothetical protein